MSVGQMFFSDKSHKASKRSSGKVIKLFLFLCHWYSRYIMVIICLALAKSNILRVKPESWPSGVGAMTLIITTFSIMTLSIMGLFVTLSINGTQHKWHAAQLTISIETLCIECHYAERYYAGCYISFIVMLNVVMLSVVILSVVMLNVVMLIVVVPPQALTASISLGCKSLHGTRNKH